MAKCGDWQQNDLLFESYDGSYLVLCIGILFGYLYKFVLDYNSVKVCEVYDRSSIDFD